MSKKVFIGGLNWSIKEEDLIKAFESLGKIITATVIRDRMTSRSKGYGFITFEDDQAADLAIKQMNGKTLDGKNITVSLAQEKTPR